MIKTHKISKPNVYNGDELNLNYHSTGKFSIEKKGKWQVKSLISNSQEKLRITVLLTASANGDKAPVYIIFKGKLYLFIYEINI